MPGPAPFYSDAPGATYGCWTVIGSAPRSSRGLRQVYARCKCGREYIRRLDYLYTGRTKSCRDCWKVPSVPSPEAQFASLLDTDWAYIAGFIDGEGSIMARVSNPKRRPGTAPTFSVVLSVSQITRGVLDRLQRRLGVGRVNSRVEVRNSDKLIHRYDVHRQADVHALIPWLMPYADVKREQLSLAWQLLDRIRKGVGMDGPGGGVTAEEIGVRLWIVEEIRRLKHPTD